MALTPIKGTLINLEDVFVNTEDDVRYVCDRYSMWRLDELAGRSKLEEALRSVGDGAYTLTASGAVKPHARYTSPPQLARLVPESHEGSEMEETP